MSKCRYCGKEYDGGGLWDDGFCCGRCRSLAKNRKIMGRPPKGCIYIILIGVVFMLIFVFLNPPESKSRKKQSKHDKPNTEQKRNKKKDKEKAASWQTSTQSNEAEKPAEDTKEEVATGEEIAPIEEKTAEEDNSISEDANQEQSMSITEEVPNTEITE